ncbi:hypothetical protein SESBI_07642 [Sesbania bispinosa]|nr:hypothetical protein SESBI_07642 [Sesbania bispinosa]
MKTTPKNPILGPTIDLIEHERSTNINLTWKATPMQIQICSKTTNTNLWKQLKGRSSPPRSIRSSSPVDSRIGRKQHTRENCWIKAAIT